MTEPNPCETDCPAHIPEPLTVQQVLDRFEQEATQGTHFTGHYHCPYYIWGNGPTILFLHGLADNSYSFLWLAALLSDSFRCVAYDLPMGKEDGANLRKLTHEHLVQDVSSLLNHLEIERSYLLGSSFGCTVALSAMANDSQRFPRALLQAPLAYQPLKLSERVISKSMSWMPGTLEMMPFREKILKSLHYDALKSRPEVWDFYLQYSGELPIKAVGRHAQILHRLDLREKLTSIQQPILLVRGSKDTVISPAVSEQVYQSLPNAGYTEIENAGHLPSLSHPEELAVIAKTFFTRPSSDCSVDSARIPLPTQ